MYKVEWHLILFPPPCIWFSSPRRVASRYKIFYFFTLKAIIQYILGFNSVKLCCSNYILPFGTAKTVKSSKNFFFLFFKLLIFFPISKPFDFIPPPHRGGEYSTLYTPASDGSWWRRFKLNFVNTSFILHFTETTGMPSVMETLLLTGLDGVDSN